MAATNKHSRERAPGAKETAVAPAPMPSTDLESTPSERSDPPPMELSAALLRPSLCRRPNTIQVPPESGRSSFAQGRLQIEGMPLPWSSPGHPHRASSLQFQLRVRRPPLAGSAHSGPEQSTGLQE